MRGRMLSIFLLSGLVRNGMLGTLERDPWRSQRHHNVLGIVLPWSYQVLGSCTH